MPRPQDTAGPARPESQLPEGLKVLRVDSGTVGARVGIQPGDRLMSLNGHALGDVIDLWFQSAAQRLKITWMDSEGLTRERTVRKAFHERLGIEVEPFEIRRCTNYCVFCFVHQLPTGMRRELYIKDEDYRLSFLYGNYITGTTLSPADISRILRMKLSPLYFSVHATDQ
jgi:NifB/MoaA-like Fe-S oxidoreductase